MELHQEKQIAMRVSTISVFVNVGLSVFKLIAGIIAHSGAMISDAIHSASDVFSTFIVMIGVAISNKASDDKHQYGHERMECIASILLAVILFMTGCGIGKSGIEQIINEEAKVLEAPGVLALIAAVSSIAIKEWMFWFTRAAAHKINSTALMADAWHHRSDALSSIGSFIGIFGARLGYPILDPIASVVICLFIVKASIDILRDAIGKVVDTSCDSDTIEKMKTTILKQEGVVRIDMMKTRLFGSKIYVDIEIAADGNLKLTESHQIAESVHHAIETDFPTVKHCMVHVNPDQPNEV